MIDRTTIEQQLPHTIGQIFVSGLGEKYEGKVRDCYVRDTKRVLVTSDRLSAFDVVLTTIPFKGQVLNGIASYWFRETKHLVPNHILAEPHPNVLVSQEAKVLPVEVVVRGYLTGSAWRDYQSGNMVSGIALPKGMRRFQRFDHPLITPSTKAEKGTHDEPISGEELLRRGIVEPELWAEVCEAALQLFAFGTKRAAERGLILVDTKYEFGTITTPGGKRQLLLVDEVHTPDSSRYWLESSFKESFAEGEEPVMLDKEFVRGWLIERGYMGHGTPPPIPDSFRVDTAVRYIELFERITGTPFAALSGPQLPVIERALREALGQTNR